MRDKNKPGRVLNMIVGPFLAIFLIGCAADAYQQIQEETISEVKAENAELKVKDIIEEDDGRYFAIIADSSYDRGRHFRIICHVKTKVMYNYGSRSDSITALVEKSEDGQMVPVIYEGDISELPVIEYEH